MIELKNFNYFAKTIETLRNYIDEVRTEKETHNELIKDYRQTYKPDHYRFKEVMENAKNEHEAKSREIKLKAITIVNNEFTKINAIVDEYINKSINDNEMNDLKLLTLSKNISEFDKRAIVKNLRQSNYKAFIVANRFLKESINYVSYETVKKAIEELSENVRGLFNGRTTGYTKQLLLHGEPFLNVEELINGFIVQNTNK